MDGHDKEMLECAQAFNSYGLYNQSDNGPKYKESKP